VTEPVDAGDPVPGIAGSGPAAPAPAEVAAFAAARTAVLDRIGEAAARSGRSASTVRLVAISKTVPAGRLRAAVAAGLDVLGENRVQEAAAKIPLVPGAAWHLVGPLQSNKARLAVELFGVIETVHSVDLARRLDRLAREVGSPAAGVPGGSGGSPKLTVLLQVNVDEDPAKAGFEPAVLEAALPELLALDTLEVAGLMTVGRLVATADEARRTFRGLRTLAERLRAAHPALGPELSMGMSDDYAVAVEEGATIVRVGRALFGARPVPDAQAIP
jgi:hypothetical protein